MRTALLLALLLIASGCTARMWATATEKHFELPTIIGDGAGRPVARYQRSHGERVRYFAVPLDASSPLVYRGPGRDAIDADLPAAQRAALVAYRFPRESVLPSEQFADRNAPYVDKLTLPTVSWQVVGLDADGHAMKPVRVRPPARNLDDRVDPAAVTILLLPETQPRDPGERRRAIAGAVVATPVTLVVDAVTLPLALIGVLTGMR